MLSVHRDYAPHNPLPAGEDRGGGENDLVPKAFVNLGFSNGAVGLWVLSLGLVVRHKLRENQPLLLL